MKITAEFLRKMRACESQVSIFERAFPDGAEVTAESLAKAHAAGLGVAWVAQNTSSPPALLKILAAGADADVRRGVAQNTSSKEN